MNPYLIDRILRSCRLKDLDVWYEIPLLRPFIKKIWKENILKKIKWKTNPITYIRTNIDWGLTWHVYKYKHENKNIKIKIYCLNQYDHINKDEYGYDITIGYDMLYSNSTLINFIYDKNINTNILDTYIHYCGHKNDNSICIINYNEDSQDHITIKDNGSNIKVLKDGDCLCNKIPTAFEFPY
jgi:hypothetical protein